jgi:uncharacterized protein (DUF433 family)
MSIEFVKKHIHEHPDYLWGQPTFKDTRCMPEVILAALKAGETLEDLQNGWPYLTQEMLDAALEWQRLGKPSVGY